MNIAMILSSVICGFIGGVLGAMVLHEILDQKYEKKIANDAQKYAVITHKLDQADARYKTVTVAIEQLTYRVVKDRGQIWQSLNDLWNDYDERHKQPEPEVEQTDAEPVTEPTETGKKRTKRARKDNETDETEHTV